MSVGDGWTRVSPLPVWASLIYHLAEAPPWVSELGTAATSE